MLGKPGGVPIYGLLSTPSWLYKSDFRENALERQSVMAHRDFGWHVRR